MLDVGKVSYRNFSMQLLELVYKKGSDHLFNIILIIYTTRTFLDCTICGFFPIFSFRQTRGGSYHRSYKLDKERVSLSPNFSKQV